MANGKRQYGYGMRVLIAIDQLAHAIAGGDPDETISSALGKRKLARGGRLLWRDWYGLARPLDWFLDAVDPYHSLRAIEDDEGDRPEPPGRTR